jgi:hypothetical protein
VSVFIIINEWTDIMGNTSSEVVGATYFISENAAHDALALIAESLNEEIDVDDTSFVSERDPHLQFQEYYIQELVQA